MIPMNRPMTPHQMKSNNEDMSVNSIKAMKKQAKCFSEF